MKRFHLPFAARVSLVYAVGAGLWILLSDRLLELLFQDVEALSLAQTYKGWFFVGVTGLMLYFILRNERAQVEKNYKNIYEQAAEGFFRSSPEGRYLTVNPAMAQMYGYESPEDMIASITDIGTQVHVKEESRLKFIHILEHHESVEKFEAPNLRKDGKIIWTSTNARVVRDPEGRVLYFEGIVEDISERRRMERKLDEAELRYQEIVEQIPASVYTDAVDESSTNLYSSPQVRAITGYSPREWIEDPDLWRKMLHPEDKDRVLREHARATRNKTDYNVEYRIIAKNGRVVWIRDHAKMFLNHKGEPLYWQGILLDITEQKRADEAVRQSEERFSKVFQSSPIPTCITSWTDGVFIDANPAYWSLSGYSPEELLGRTVIDLKFMDTEKREKLLEQLRQEKSLARVEDKLFTKTGAILDVYIFYEIIRLNDRDCILSMFYDITEQKRMQDALSGSEKRFRSLIEHSMDVIALGSADGTIIFQSPAAGIMLGYSSGEMTGRSGLDFIHPTDRFKAIRALRKIMMSPEAKIVTELRAIHKDGSTRWLEIVATNRLDEPGVEAIVANYRDITERKRADQFLREAEARYRALVENIPAVIYMDLASDESTIYINPHIETLTGYTPEEWITDNSLWGKLIHPDDRRRVLQEDSLTNESGDTFNIEYRMIAKDGHVVSVRELASLIRDSEGEPLFWQGVIIDITEQKRAQEGLKRREAILGAMAYAADQFLKSEKWKNNISAILGRLGAVSETSRVYIFQRDNSPNNISLASMLYEWCAPGIDSQVDVAALQNLDLKKIGLQRWLQRFDQGEPIYSIVRELPIQEQDLFVRNKVLSLICVPIMIGRSWWGFIRFDDCVTERDWNPSEIEALRTAANILSSAIQREQATEAVQRQLRELTMLHAVALASSSASSLDELILRVTNIIGDTLVPDSYGILLVTKNDQGLRPHPSYQGTDKKNLDLTLKIGEGITGQAALLKMPICVPDTSSSTEYIEVTKGIKSELSVPIISAERVIGIINLESKRENAFTNTEERLVNTIAGSIGTAIDKLRLFEAQQRRARESDSLREATSALTRSLDLPTLLDLTLDLLPSFAPFDSASIMLKEADDDMYVAAVRGLPDKLLGLRLEWVSKWNWLKTNREPLILSDALHDTRFQKISDTDYVRGWMGVPLVANEQVIGLLNLDSRTPDTYTQEQAILVQTFANQAAIAIQNARLFESEQQRRQEAENLRVAASAITSSLDSKQVLETILVALKQVVPYDSASMLLLDGDVVRITAAKGLPLPNPALNQSFPASNKLLAAIQENGQPLILHNAQEDPRFENWAAGADIRGWMGVPLTIRGQIVGFIILDSYVSGSFDNKSASLAQTFAHQAAAAIDNARLYEETRRRLEEMEIVSRISYTLRTAQDAEEMLPILYSEVLNIMKTDTGSIWLFDEGKGKLVQRIAAGWSKNVPVVNFRPGEGIVGHVFATGEPYLIEDFINDPHSHPENRKTFEPNWGGIALPIRTTTDVIGVIVVAVPSSRRVEPHQVQLMTTIAEIAGNAMHRINLYDRSEDQVKRLIALRDVDMAIAGSFDLQVTLNILLDHIVSQLKVDAAAIQAFNPDMQILTPLASLGFYRQANAQTTLRISEGFAGKILIDRNDVHIYDPDQEAGFRRKDQLTGEGFVSYYATPLVSKGQTKGVLETFFRRSFAPDAYWLEFLHAMAGQAAIAIDNAQLFENLQRSNQELSLAYDTTLEGWGKALELRDKETQGHTLRVTDMTLRLARRVGISESELTHIRRGVLLHDIGKMGVPDHILKKTGSLSEEEWVQMRQHPKHAYDLLYPITYLRRVLDIPYCHHERWDGSGYPRGIKGGDIPLAARVFAIVDVWDALLYDRPYRKAWPRERVINFIREQAGSRFDPAVAKEFLRMVEEDEKAG